MPNPRKVVIVGAGLSGLVAGRELLDAGLDVCVLDKGRSVGGRLATRRIGDARLDHGAQFFTVRTPAFRRRVDDWLERGIVAVWNHGFDDDDGHPRYVGATGMNSIAKDLAVGLDVETSTLAFGVRPMEGVDAPHRWEVVIDDGTTRPADAVIFTCPLVQTFALLADIGVWKSGDEATDAAHDAIVERHGIHLDQQLFRTQYDRTIALLATVDGPTAIGAAGGVQHGDDVFSFIGDNQAKGISEAPAITFHANAEWSEAHWDDDSADTLAALEAAAQPWLGSAAIVERQLKTWRFATPRTIWPDPCWSTADGTIVVAGDAFAGPKVEGAHNSGLAAAHSLLA
ncbi:MAG: NAD(P)/FAD-dependent oxidoreductase [Ilumatobacter sp.]|uniref:NAD(P)/FAD-dependent oxidoreductase n=1 Tax=Ilumatobacter sp. TaxID=1967498 RepID=UPI00391DAD66